MELTQRTTPVVWTALRGWDLANQVKKDQDPEQANHTRDHEQGPPRGSRVLSSFGPAGGFLPAGFPRQAASIRDIASSGRPMTTRHFLLSNNPKGTDLNTTTETKKNWAAGLDWADWHRLIS